MARFTKQERLCGRILIESVMTGGKTISNEHFRIRYLAVSDLPAPAQVMISVPKRIHRRAVVRNRIKRLMREVYRNRKEELYTKIQGKQLLLIITCVSREVPDHRITEMKITALLKRLAE